MSIATGRSPTSKVAVTDRVARSTTDAEHELVCACVEYFNAAGRTDVRQLSPFSGSSPWPAISDDSDNGDQRDADSNRYTATSTVHVPSQSAETPQAPHSCGAKETPPFPDGLATVS
jgi:hypothetical protein